MQAHSTKVFQAEGAVASLQCALAKAPKDLPLNYIRATRAQVSFTPVHPSKRARRTRSTRYEKINHYAMSITCQVSRSKIVMDDCSRVFTTQRLFAPRTWQKRVLDPAVLIHDQVE